MPNYSPSYKAIAELIFQSNEELIRQWANSQDEELSDSCKMLIEAAGQAAQDR